MKAKTKFLKIYYKLPIMARSELVIHCPYEPISLKLAKAEIENNTDKGFRILNELGFEDD